jgi:hypothetical protein
MPFGNGGNNTWLYDYKTGHLQHSTLSLTSATTNALFQAEIKKYTKFWNTKFAPLATIGYKVRKFSDETLSLKPDQV